MILDNFLSSKLVKDGDILEIHDAGELKEGIFKGEKTGKIEAHFQVRFNNHTYTLRMNKTSQRNLSSAWGSDTDKWKGKKASIKLEKTMLGNAIILTPESAWDS